jgi:uncharacterized protein HemY
MLPPKNILVSRNDLMVEVSGRPFIEAAEFAIMINCGDVADKCLAHDIVLNSPSVLPSLLLCRLEIQRRNFSKANDALESALAVNNADPDVWTALGHLYFLQHKFAEAKAAYETVLSLNHGKFIHLL